MAKTTMKKSNQSASTRPARLANESVAGRPPVVAILGHVDHGKTTLLDTIRKTNVAAREHGGITQSIGAFTHNNITFIDTPGHAAFTKMRGRGVSVADIVILVVASDDGVMPQTRESLAHIKEAKTPFIVALTKSDLSRANPEKVKQQLLKEGITLEGLGGDVPVVSVSAKTGKGIDDLLEVILLVSQMTGIKGTSHDPLAGVIIEAKRDRRKGVVATVIVQAGTLAVGDEIMAEQVSGKVRALITDTGAVVKQVRPGSPVEILGFDDVPAVGARVVGKTKGALATAQTTSSVRVPESEKKRLGLILKADTQGSLEAIIQSLPKDDVNLILAATGDPSEADILLARASGAIVLGFNTTPSAGVMKLAEIEGVIVKTYKIIYELLAELEEVVALSKEGKAVEIILGRATILAVFPYDNKNVAGCKIVEGRMARGDKVRVERNGESLGAARIASIRHGKEDVGKAEMPSECGILFSSPLDFDTGDVILSVR